MDLDGFGWGVIGLVILENYSIDFDFLIFFKTVAFCFFGMWEQCATVTQTG